VDCQRVATLFFLPKTIIKKMLTDLLIGKKSFYPYGVYISLSVLSVLHVNIIEWFQTVMTFARLWPVMWFVAGSAFFGLYQTLHPQMRKKGDLMSKQLDDHLCRHWVGRQFSISSASLASKWTDTRLFVRVKPEIAVSARSACPTGF